MVLAAEVKKQTFHRGTSQQKPQTSISLEYDTSGLQPEAVQELRDYFVRIGRSRESSRILNEEKADRMRKLREDAYRDVRTILKKYRGFKHAHAATVEDLKDRFYEAEGVNENGETVKYLKLNAASDTMPFTAIAQRLELMSISEEKEFNTRYFPQIEIMQRMEVVIQAVDSALSIYASQKPTFAKLIRELYIDGDRKPTNAEVMERFNYSEPYFYKIINIAVEDITVIMFGTGDKQHINELRAICARFSLNQNALGFLDI